MNNRRILWIFLTVLFCTISQVAFAEKRIGIFVGTNEGSLAEEPLKYAVNDAAKMKNTFVSWGKMATEDALFLKHPDREELITTLKRTSEKVARLQETGERVVLVFYFNGHGDRQYLHLGKENFSRRKLMTQLKGFGADLVISIIDACQTERKARQKGVRVQPRFDVSAARLETHEGVVSIQSTMEGNPAYESDQLQSALFTHHFVSALRGAADLNQDKRITLLEAYSYSYRETVQSSAEDSQIIQQPHFNMTFRGAGDFVLTDLQRTKSTVTIEGNADARYLLFSKPPGQPIAEVFVEKKKRVSLAVTHGNILIHKRTAHGAYAAEVYIPRKGTANVTAEQFKRIHIENHTLKGSANLHPHQLTTGYLFSAEHFIAGWRPAQGASLGYQYLFRKWVLSLEGEIHFSSFQNNIRTSKEMTIGLFALIGWRLPLKRSALLFLAGPGIQIFRQKSSLLDHDRIQAAGLGIEESQTDRLVVPGGKILGEWQFLFLRNFGTFLRAGVSGFYYRNVVLSADSSMIRWQLMLGGGLYVRF